LAARARIVASPFERSLFMRRNDRRSGLIAISVAAVLCASLPPRANAEGIPAPAAAGEGITGVGVATIERPPNVLRMQVELTAQGTDMADAVKKLRAAEAAARKKLAELGATESSVSASPINDGSARSSRQAQMEYYMRQQMAARGKKPATNPAASTSVSLTLKADWPLSGSGDELLVNASTLAQKIKAADVAGKKAAAASMTPEQQEEAEEHQGNAGQQAEAMAEMNAGIGPNAGGMPGEPKFTYVATLTEEEQTKATADAFAKARVQAGRLAKAAGTDLGALRQLTSQRASTADSQNPTEYMAALYQNMLAGGRPPGTEDSAEAVGTSPTNVGVRITVTASFATR
jgi:uncharacterized protein YggE